MLFAVCYVLLLSACGRRGDPVLVKPPEVKAVDRKTDEVQKTGEGSQGQGVVPAVIPAAPARLRGVFTQTSIILTWDEVPGKNIRYRIYRSAGDSYILAGETVTPAFTDSKVEPNMKYRYRITAVDVAEGPPSEEIIIITEIQ